MGLFINNFGIFRMLYHISEYPVNGVLDAATVARGRRDGIDVLLVFEQVLQPLDGVIIRQLAKVSVASDRLEDSVLGVLTYTPLTNDFGNVFKH